MKTNKKFNEELVDVFKEASKDKALLADFLLDVLTPGEVNELATRWQIVKQLAQGRAQRDIAKDLHIGIATVTRGSRELSDKNGGFAKMIRKLGLDK